jgi:hypothetical protein
MVVCTDEVLRSSNPSAELLIRNDLLNATARAIDDAFIDETNAGIANVMPTAVNHNLTPAADLQLLIAGFTGDLSVSYFVGHPAYFAGLAGSDHPNIGARGGSLLGIPAISSSACSPDVLTLVDPTGLVYSEGSAEIRTSRQATIQMLDNPTNNSATGTATTMVSLYQVNSTALLAEVAVNWSVARPGSVAILSSASV